MNIQKRTIKGKKIIEGSNRKLDLKTSDINKLINEVVASGSKESIFELINQTFYSGVSVGYELGEKAN